MAYMSQERKAQIAPSVKAICKKYGVKASLSVRNHSTLALTVTQGDIDFIKNFNDVCGKNDTYKVRQPVTNNYLSVNPYHYRNHFTDRALKFLTEVHTAMMQGNHDRSDIQSDYFDVGWYVDINIGRWDRPYALVK